ncbi:norrin isoform X2 [Spea bombifrons]|uniref:norrin isoform X2 n=1 Tax=Spea bombifrons TaxID=233779 RepID=UPI00234AF040|nr:norrin isoform X2 [Spea bombifrons]
MYVFDWLLALRKCTVFVLAIAHRSIFRTGLNSSAQQMLTYDLDRQINEIYQVRARIKNGSNRSCKNIRKISVTEAMVDYQIVGNSKHEEQAWQLGN